MRPRIALMTGVTSGDDDKNDPDLQTFNPYYPKGNYFGEATLLGPQNDIHLRPSVELHLPKNLVVTPNWTFWWRQNTADGVYRINVVPQVAADASPARYIGSQPELYVEWQLERHLQLGLAYSYFFTGTFLKEAGLGKNGSYVGAWLTYKM